MLAVTVALALQLFAEFPRGACGPAPFPLRVVPIPNASVVKASAQPHKCALFVFLHPQSSGGTSIESLLGVALAAGDWECVKLSAPELGRRMTDAFWVQAHPRIYFRMHGSLSRSRPLLATVLAARAAYETQLKCRLIVGAVLRDPVSHVLSWYNHFAVRKYRNTSLAALLRSDTVDGQQQSSGERCAEPGARACTRFGAGKGANVRGMYLREIGAALGPAPATSATVRGAHTVASLVANPVANPLAWCDWVGLTETMAASMLQLADLLSLRVVPNLHIRHYGIPKAVIGQPAATLTGPNGPNWAGHAAFGGPTALSSEPEHVLAANARPEGEGRGLGTLLPRRAALAVVASQLRAESRGPGGESAGEAGAHRRRLRPRRPSATAFMGPQEVLDADWLAAQLSHSFPPWRAAQRAVRERLAAHAAADLTFASRLAIFTATPRYSIKYCAERVCLLASPRQAPGVAWPPDQSLLLCPRGSDRWMPAQCRAPGVYRGK